jgi:hypothetical protein
MDRWQYLPDLLCLSVVAYAYDGALGRFDHLERDDMYTISKQYVHNMYTVCKQYVNQGCTNSEEKWMKRIGLCIRMAIGFIARQRREELKWV